MKPAVWFLTLGSATHATTRSSRVDINLADGALGNFHFCYEVWGMWAGVLKMGASHVVYRRLPRSLTCTKDDELVTWQDRRIQWTREKTSKGKWHDKKNRESSGHVRDASQKAS